MITRFHVKNFKCLKDVELELGQFNVFIGPNDSGKSSLIDAICSVGRTTSETWQGVFPGDPPLRDFIWGRDLSQFVAWRVEGTSASGNFAYNLKLSALEPNLRNESLAVADKQIIENVTEPNDAPLFKYSFGKDSHQFRPPQYTTALLGASGPRDSTGTLLKPSPMADVIKVMSSCQKIRLDPDQLRRGGARQLSPMLLTTGGNLVAVLNSIMTDLDRETILGLEDSLRGRFPYLHTISVKGSPQNPNELVLHYSLGEQPPRIPIAATMVSDGVLLWTAFLALAYGNTADTLLIEEPENGLHPA